MKYAGYQSNIYVKSDEKNPELDSIEPDDENSDEFESGGVDPAFGTSGLISGNDIFEAYSNL